MQKPAPAFVRGTSVRLTVVQAAAGGANAVHHGILGPSRQAGFFLRASSQKFQQIRSDQTPEN